MTHPLEIMQDGFSILRLSAEAPVPGFVTQTMVWSVTRTDRELSILCSSQTIPEDFQPEELQRIDGYRAVRVAGSLDFNEIGILARLLHVLAEAKISVLTLSTFDTDYIFVAGENFDAAISSLQANGYDV